MILQKFTTMFMLFGLDISRLQASHILMYIAVFSTSVFLFVFVATLFGVGIDDSLDDIEIENSSFLSNSISFKNVIYFLMFFSWGTMTFLELNLGGAISILYGSFLSLIFTFLLNLLLGLFLKLQENHTTDINDALNSFGNVYLTASNKQIGKVQVKVNGANRIYDAIADKGTIKTGSMVKVIHVNKDTNILTITTNYSFKF
jgi:hypothetical protein